MFLRVCGACLSLLLLVGCASKGQDKYVERSVEELYNEGLAFLQEEAYEDAAKAFDEVDRQHPYSPWALRAQLMSAYAYYQDRFYDEALAALETFVQLHPGHEHAVYAHYMQGLCYYEQMASVLRDQKVAELAELTFANLIRRFPDTPYAKAAQLKLDLIYDHIAGREMEVGRFYQLKKGWPAAINRFQRVVSHKYYQTTTHAPEALYRLVESYTALGLKDQAQKSAAVLGHNYPGNSWYVEAYRLLQGDNHPHGETEEIIVLSEKEDQAQGALEG
ncbi:MAG: outer membrane protein assembly factor BamD [bacterium]|nr:outer membrane protein assembly factor BamD [bacterium]